MTHQIPPYPLPPSPAPEGWRPRMNPWHPDDVTPHMHRRLGKTAEELGELQAVIARIQIQGLHAVDPSSGKTNFQRLTEETADVLAQLECNLAPFALPLDVIDLRVTAKIEQMHEWEQHYTGEADR